MKCIGLDGRSYNLHVERVEFRENESKLHTTARQIIKEIFPCDTILEEVRLPGSKLIADFLIFRPKLIIEVHGQQHYKYNSHFFNNKIDFLSAQKRDRDKIQWAEINNMRLIELPYNAMDDWRDIIVNSR